jgi:outer membrane immunogenic protein
MSKFFKTLLIGSASIAAISTASAADLPSTKAPVAVPVMALYSWTGFYMGANIGYAFVNSDRVGMTTAPAGPFIGTFGNARGDGVVGGLQIGYNWQSANWVFGLEADIQISGVKDTTIAGGLTTRTSHDWFGTLRGRLGYAMDRTLLYVTAGGAITDYNYNMTGAFTMARSTTGFSWTAGAGIEHAFSGQWTGKIEYLYVDTGKKSLLSTPATEFTRATQGFHLVRLGVNYRF